MSWYLFCVDDLFLIGDEQLIEQCKRELTSEFEMKDLELMLYFLGLEVWQKPGEIFLTQGKYLAEIWDARLQVHERTHDYQLDNVVWINH